MIDIQPNKLEPERTRSRSFRLFQRKRNHQRKRDENQEQGLASM